MSSARACGLRPVAMTRRAPRDLAICTASWPETPVAPRMRTLSPGWNWARIEGDGGRHGGIGDGGGGGVGEPVGDGDKHGGVGEGLLGEGAEGRARAAEEDAGAGGELAEGRLEAANTVDAGDEGEDAGAAVVGAVGERFDDAVKGGGGTVTRSSAGRSWGRGWGRGRRRWCRWAGRRRIGRGQRSWEPPE